MEFLEQKGEKQKPLISRQSFFHCIILQPTPSFFHVKATPAWYENGGTITQDTVNL